MTGRRLILWLVLCAFGLLPAGLLVYLQDPRPAGPPWSTLQAEAAGRAQALDAHVGRWMARTAVVAREVAGLFTQLPPGEIGPAAEGTLMLHLQQRLKEDGEMGEYSVVAPKGKVLLSTDGTRVGTVAGRAFPEVAQAARRPAVALVRASAKTTQLVVGAPIRVAAGELRGIFVARLKPQTTRDLLRPSIAGVKVDVVDGAGLTLAGRFDLAAELLELGSESRRGRRWLKGGIPAAFAPLRQVRAVAVAVGPPRAPGGARLHRWHLVGGGVILLLGGVVAWLLGRLSWGR